MDDNQKAPQSDETPEADNNEEGIQGGGVNKDTSKTFSQDEVNDIVTTRLKKETEKLESKWSEKLKKEMEEAERTAALSAEEKEKELQKKKEEEFAQRARDLTLRENRADGVEALSEKGIPTKFIDFILNEDKDAMNERIEALHSEWSKAIKEEVKVQLKGKTPTDPTSEPSSNSEEAIGNTPTVM